MSMPHDGYVKLLEEMMELGIVAAKRISVGGDSYFDGTDLHLEAMNEIADVLATIDYVLTTNFYAHEIKIIRSRRKAKLATYKGWAKEADYVQPIGNSQPTQQ